MSTYDPDHRGIGEMLASVAMQDHMRERAEKIADAARAIAPTGPGAELEHYKDSFEVSSGVLYRFSGKRAFARVTNSSDHAAAIEFSNFRTRKKTIDAQHVLGRSIDAARG
jgi:hypothetical protein